MEVNFDLFCYAWIRCLLPPITGTCLRSHEFELEDALLEQLHNVILSQIHSAIINIRIDFGVLNTTLQLLPPRCGTSTPEAKVLTPMMYRSGALYF